MRIAPHLRAVLATAVAAGLALTPALTPPAAAQDGEKPPDKLPVVVHYAGSGTFQSGHAKIVCRCSYVLHGELDRVDKWSAPHKEQNYYRGKLSITYSFRFQAFDLDPDRDCPPLVAEYSCAGGGSEQRQSRLCLNYWGQVHKGREPEYDFSASGLGVTAHGKKEHDYCHLVPATMDLRMGSVDIDGKYTRGQTIRGSCTWRGPTEPLHNTLTKNPGASIEDGKIVHPMPMPGWDIHGTVAWVFGEEALVLIEQKCGGEWTDITDPDWTQPAVVGEAIELRGRVFPKSKDPGTGEWTIEHDAGGGSGDAPKFIRKFEADAGRGKVVELTDDDRKKPEILFYWVDAGGGRVKYVTTVDGEPCDAEAEFDIERPEVDLTVTAQDESTFGRWKDGYILAYQKGETEGMQWKVESIDKPGETQYVQLVDQQSEAAGIAQSDHPGPQKHNGKGLDASYPYARGAEAKDNPAVPSDWRFSRRSTQFTFKMYLMFKPAGREDNEWVPIKRTDWSWAGEIAWDADAKAWREVYSREPTDPQPVDTAVYPEWDVNSGDFPVRWRNPETGRWEKIPVKWRQ